MIRTKQKKIRQVTQKSNTKNPIRYLSVALINKHHDNKKLLSDYLNDITNKGEEDYTDLASKCNLIFTPLQVSCNIIDIIYLGNTPTFPETEKTFNVQLAHIRLLQGLKRYTSETLTKALYELDVHFFFHYKFDICFQFLHASSIYSETKQIPKRVFNILRIENEELDSNEVRQYMEYVSEVTQKCLADIIADALNYLNIWCPSLFISSKENEDKFSSQCETDVQRTKKSKNNSSSKKVRFQFNSENFISNKINSDITATANIGDKDPRSRLKQK